MGWGVMDCPQWSCSNLATELHSGQTDTQLSEKAENTLHEIKSDPCLLVSPLVGLNLSVLCYLMRFKHFCYN